MHISDGSNYSTIYKTHSCCDENNPILFTRNDSNTGLKSLLWVGKMWKNLVFKHAIISILMYFLPLYVQTDTMIQSKKSVTYKWHHLRLSVSKVFLNSLTGRKKKKRSDVHLLVTLLLDACLWWYFSVPEDESRCTAHNWFYESFPRWLDSQLVFA